MDSKTIDLGFSVARMHNSFNLLEILSPVDIDENGHLQREAQYICIQGSDNIERLRDALNELLPKKE